MVLHMARGGVSCKAVDFYRYPINLGPVRFFLREHIGLVESLTGILGDFFRILSLPSVRTECGSGGDFVRQWVRLWGGRLAAYFGKEEGNVFIENGIWIIIVVLAMILPIEALRNALVNAFGQITSNLNAIP